jgi:uncharacterized membrane protein YgcG
MKGIIRAIATLTLVTALASLIWLPAAHAETVFDDQGDVLSCTGECSIYDQDLSAVTVDDSGGTITFTIDQYGAFTSGCRCFFPQVHIFTGSTTLTAPDFYIANYVGSPPNAYPMGVFDYAVSQANPCGSGPGHYGGAYGAGLTYAVTPTIVSPTEVVYSFPASAIGNPASFGWRVVEPAQSRCQTQGNPETAPLDSAPDVGMLTHGVTGGGGSGGGGSSGGSSGGTSGGAAGSGGALNPGNATLPSLKPSISHLKATKKGISLTVTCKAPCASVQGKGTFVAGRKSFHKSAAGHVANGTASLKLTISKKVKTAINKALRAGKKPAAKVTVTSKSNSGSVLGTATSTVHFRRSFH